MRILSIDERSQLVQAAAPALATMGLVESSPAGSPVFAGSETPIAVLLDDILESHVSGAFGLPRERFTVGEWAAAHSLDHEHVADVAYQLGATATRAGLAAP